MTVSAPVRSASAGERTHNPLRPAHLYEVVGQDKAKALMQRAIQSCFERVKPLEHTLLVAESGTGKSTFSHVIANELGVRVFEVEAPVSFDTLLDLREQMQPCEILKIEEIHQQGIMERRGRSSATQPEVLYAVMEDRVIPTERGILEFPPITIIGTTTDEGMLPDAFINRFPLRPRLVPYTETELRTIVRGNALTLKVNMDEAAIELFAGACRGIPREVNNLVRNASILTPPSGTCDIATALAVLDMNGVTTDGLTGDMQAMLTFLYTRAARRTGDGTIVHQASVNTIATAIGKSRDSKAIALRVEPLLIRRGLVQVGHGGRLLTPAGERRARELLDA